VNRDSNISYAVKIIDLLQEEAPTIEEVQNEVILFKNLMKFVSYSGRFQKMNKTASNFYELQ
jgi:hypothetical protein